jgi:hypothetical protein
MNIFNGTPHVITIISSENTAFNAAQRKVVLTGEKKVIVELPSNGVLSAKMAKTDLNPINGITIKQSKFVSVDSLPDGYDYYLVSAMFVAACREVGVDTSKLLTIGDAVYSDGDFKPCGTLNLNLN